MWLLPRNMSRQFGKNSGNKKGRGITGIAVTVVFIHGMHLDFRSHPVQWSRDKGCGLDLLMPAAGCLVLKQAIQHEMTVARTRQTVQEQSDACAAVSKTAGEPREGIAREGYATPLDLKLQNAFGCLAS